jgi:signal transduction histidine kinase
MEPGGDWFLSMVRIRVSRRLLGFRALLAILLAVIFAVFEQLADVHLARRGLSHADILLDDMVGAALLGVIAFLWVTAVDEHHRRVRAEERHELTAEMNHHIRNALTVIKYAAYSDSRAERVRMTDEAVERIESTLRELLPTVPGEQSSDESEIIPPARRAI